MIVLAFRNKKTAFNTHNVVNAICAKRSDILGLIMLDPTRKAVMRLAGL